ncbi:MAG TPA: HAD family hydrolase [Dehalococcoidia bacterium]|nr:HAD family hydrolase [Dehalococcoidia bacterium]
MSLRAVFFDLDDTLLPTTSSRPERARRAFDYLREAHPEHPGLRDWHRFYDSLLAYDHSTGFIRGMRPVLEELGLWQTPAGDVAHGHWFFDGSIDLIASYPDVPAVVEALRAEYTLGLITNGEGVHQRRKLDALGIAHHFDVVLISGEFGQLKPSRAIFEQALSLAGVSAREAVHVGDNLDADVYGAKSAGMRAVWFNAERRHSYWDSPLPDASISSFDQLASVLNRWR